MQPDAKTWPKMSTKVLMVAVLALVLAATVTILLTLWPSSMTATFRAINPNVFADGIGVYVFNNNKYSMLIWKKKFLGADNTPQENDVLEVARNPVFVQKDVRFFTYGIDFSKWPTVPPYVMAFCIARDSKTIDGVFPIRLKPLNHDTMIYELLLPPIINSLSSGTFKHLFWAINFQYSCSEGWVFKFQ